MTLVMMIDDCDIGNFIGGFPHHPITVTYRGKHHRAHYLMAILLPATFLILAFTAPARGRAAAAACALPPLFGTDCGDFARTRAHVLLWLTSLPY